MVILVVVWGGRRSNLRLHLQILILLVLVYVRVLGLFMGPKTESMLSLLD